jgi:hypothetical protein
MFRQSSFSMAGLAFHPGQIELNHSLAVTHKRVLNARRL